MAKSTGVRPFLSLTSSFAPCSASSVPATRAPPWLYCQIDGGARVAGTLLAEHGSLRDVWLAWIHLQFGDAPSATGPLVGVAVFVVAALEEVVWRGLVMRVLQDVITGFVKGIFGFFFTLMIGAFILIDLEQSVQVAGAEDVPQRRTQPA